MIILLSVLVLFAIDKANPFFQQLIYRWRLNPKNRHIMIASLHSKKSPLPMWYYPFNIFIILLQVCCVAGIIYGLYSLIF